MKEWRRHAGLAADLLLAAAIAVAPLAWGAFQSGGFALCASLVGAAWALILVSGRPAGSLRIARSPLNPPLLALLGVAALSLVVTVSRPATLVEVARLAVGVGLFFALARPPASPRRLQIGLGALVVGAGACSYRAILEYVAEQAGGNTTWRVIAGFVSPNQLAGFLIVALPVAAALALTARRPVFKLAWALPAVLAVGGLFLSGSRGGQLAFLPAVVLFLLLVGHARRRPRLAWGLAAGCIGLAVLLSLAFTPLRVRLAGLVTGHDASMISRYYFWQSAARLAAAHPALGTGAGTFELVYPQYAAAGFTRMAHENYLQMAAELGLPGLAAFLWMAVAAFAAARRAWRGWQQPAVRVAVAGIAAAGTAFLLHSLVDFDWYIGAIMLAWFGVLGLLANLGLGEPVLPPPAEPRRRGKNAAPPLPAAEPLVRALGRRPVGRALLVLGVTAAAAAVIWQATSLAAADRLLAAGEAAEARADYAAARSAYLQAAAIRPDYGEALRKAARVVPFEQAEPLVQRAIALEPTRATNYALLARLQYREGDWPAAQRSYRSALRLSPHYPQVMQELATAFEIHHEYRQAEDLYERMIALQAGPYGRYRALQSPEAEFAYPHYWRARRILDSLDRRPPKQWRDAEAELRAALAPIEEAKLVPTVEHIMAAATTGQYVLPPQIRVLEARIRWRLADVEERLGRPQQARQQRDLARALEPGVAQMVGREAKLWF